jgi:hypothetical protein
VPIFRSSTVSPGTAGRVGGGAGFLPVDLGGGGGLFHLAAELGCLQLFALHGLALLFQPGEHILEADVLGVDAFGGLLNHVIRQPQAPGNGKGV